MGRRIVAAALALGAALSPGVPARGADQAPASVGAYIRVAGSLRVGEAVPDFQAKDIYGAEISLKGLLASGRKPLLAFWSVYCKACVEKFNAMVTAQRRYADRGIAVISVNTDGEYQKGDAAIREFIAAYEKEHSLTINFPVLYDERNWLPQALAIEFLPTIIAVGPDGRIVGFYQKFDESSEEEIVAGIDALARDLLSRYPEPAPGPAPAPSPK